MVTRGSGVIINLSSFLAFGGPLLSVYATSKAFVRQFSEDLQLEYKNTGSDFRKTRTMQGLHVLETLKSMK